MGNNQLKKAYIALELEENSKEEYENLKLIILKLINGNNIIFSNNLHLTLDLIGQISVKKALERLNRVDQNLSNRLYESLKSIKIGGFKSFISNRNGKRVFYLKIEGGEDFFGYLRSIGYSIEIPHITIFETQGSID